MVLTVFMNYDKTRVNMEMESESLIYTPVNDIDLYEDGKFIKSFSCYREATNFIQEDNEKWDEVDPYVLFFNERESIIITHLTRSKNEEELKELFDSLVNEYQTIAQVVGIAVCD